MRADSQTQDIAREDSPLDWLTILGFVLAIAAPSLAWARNHWLPKETESELGELSTSEREQRKLAPRPQLEWTSDALATYPRQYDEWYADHFSLRPELIRWHNRAKYQLFDISPTPQVIKGRGDWIFTANSRSTEIWRGRDPFTSEELERWRLVLEERARFCAEQGAQYVFAIAPNKNSLYPEQMAERLGEMGTTRLDQLTDYLAQHSSFQMLDLRGPLLAAKQQLETAATEQLEAERVNYYRLGTHWNKFGAAVAGYELLRPFAELGVQPWKPESFRFEWSERTGVSWITRMYMEDVLAQQKAEWTFPVEPRAERVSKRALPSGGVEYHYRVDDPALPKAVIFHDSFGRSLWPLLSEFFSESYHRDYHDFYADYVKQHQPQVVVQLATERCLSAVHNPEGPFDTQAHLRELFEASDQVLALIEPEAAEAKEEWGPLLLPNCDPGQAHWAVVAVDLEGELNNPRPESLLALEFRTERFADYSMRGRSIVRPLSELESLSPEATAARAYFILRVPRLSGPMRLNLHGVPKSDDGSSNVRLRGVEVRATPR